MLQIQNSTILFQVLNFIILLAGLAYFLYRPLLRTMRQRETAINAKIHDADERAQAAESERGQLASDIARAHADAERTLAETQAQAARERAAILEQARLDAQTQIALAQTRIAEQERQTLQAIQQKVSASAIRIAGDTIRNAAGPAVHQTLVEDLLRELPSRFPAPAEGDHPNDASEPVVAEFELAYPLTDELKARWGAVIAGSLGVTPDRVQLRFEVDPTLVAGGRLSVGTMTVDMSLRRILANLNAAAGISEPTEGGTSR